jgi:hypothetical protein
MAGILRQVLYPNFSYDEAVDENDDPVKYGIPGIIFRIEAITDNACVPSKRDLWPCMGRGCKGSGPL